MWSLCCEWGQPVVKGVIALLERPGTLSLMQSPKRFQWARFGSKPHGRPLMLTTKATDVRHRGAEHPFQLTGLSSHSPVFWWPAEFRLVCRWNSYTEHYFKFGLVYWASWECMYLFLFLFTKMLSGILLISENLGRSWRFKMLTSSRSSLHALKFYMPRVHSQTWSLLSTALFKPKTAASKSKQRLGPRQSQKQSTLDTGEIVAR